MSYEYQKLETEDTNERFNWLWNQFETLKTAILLHTPDRKYRDSHEVLDHYINGIKKFEKDLPKDLPKDWKPDTKNTILFTLITDEGDRNFFLYYYTQLPTEEVIYAIHKLGMRCEAHIYNERGIFDYELPFPNAIKEEVENYIEDISFTLEKIQYLIENS